MREVKCTYFEEMNELKTKYLCLILKYNSFTNILINLMFLNHLYFNIKNNRNFCSLQISIDGIAMIHIYTFPIS